jgi:precorrin isomerase
VADAAKERSMRSLQDRKTVLLDLRMISSEIRKAQGEKEEDEVSQALEEHLENLLQTFKNLRKAS